MKKFGGDRSMCFVVGLIVDWDSLVPWMEGFQETNTQLLREYVYKQFSWWGQAGKLDKPRCPLYTLEPLVSDRRFIKDPWAISFESSYSRMPKSSIPAPLIPVWVGFCFHNFLSWTHAVLVCLVTTSVWQLWTNQKSTEVNLFTYT